MIDSSRLWCRDIVLVGRKLECGYPEGDGRANELQHVVLTIEFLESTIDLHDAKDGTRDEGGRKLTYD